MNKTEIKYEVLTWETSPDIHTLNMALKRFNRPLLVPVVGVYPVGHTVVIVETRDRSKAQELYNKHVGATASQK